MLLTSSLEYYSILFMNSATKTWTDAANAFQAACSYADINSDEFYGSAIARGVFREVVRRNHKVASALPCANVLDKYEALIAAEKALHA